MPQRWCVIHLDIDYFYCQVEILRNPALRCAPERPVAVTQKFLVVTCNYPAREAGVTKLMRIDAARERCPELFLVAGEDLSPYREASEVVFAELCRCGPTQKLGLDEFFIDVLEAAEALLRESQSQPLGWAEGTHVHAARHGTRTAEALSGNQSNYRPMDLRSAADPAAPGSGGVPMEPCATSESDDASRALLQAASHVAARLRAEVKTATGLSCSCGIACNKLLAKFASGLHKPDAQTALPQVRMPTPAPSTRP